MLENSRKTETESGSPQSTAAPLERSSRAGSTHGTETHLKKVVSLAPHDSSGTQLEEGSWSGSHTTAGNSRTPGPQEEDMQVRITRSCCTERNDSLAESHGLSLNESVSCRSLSGTPPLLLCHL